MKSVKRESEIPDELWRIKIELVSLSFLIKAVEEAQGGEDLLGLGLILERHARSLEDLIERMADGS